MAALPADAPAGELLAGTGRVTLLRTGGGAGFGAYALLYTTRSVPGGGVEAIIAATCPEDMDPRWGLNRPQRYGPLASEERSLMRWAAALDYEKRKSETQAAYDYRLAERLVRTAHTGRIIPPPGSVDLPLANWEITTEHVISLVTKQSSAGYAGHTIARIGRLVAVAPKED
jgi:hypothetical protein